MNALILAGIFFVFGVDFYYSTFLASTLIISFVREEGLVYIVRPSIDLIVLVHERPTAEVLSLSLLPAI